jgi:hypothetical protein
MGQEARNKLLDYCRKIDQALRDQLKDGQQPLILAGVDYLLALFREVSQYPQLVAGAISGSPDRLSAKELHARAWALVQPYLRQRQADALAHFRRLEERSQTTGEVDSAVRAASQGRVEILFVALDSGHRGAPRQAGGWDRPQPAFRSEALVAAAAIHTLLHGGSVYVVAAGQMPTKGPLAAALRR